MKIRSNKLTTVLVLMTMILSMGAQTGGMLHSLHGNAGLIEYQRKLAAQHKTASNEKIQGTATATLTLPFFDEFSYPAGPYPRPDFWQNSESVFVNHTKAMAPPTLGVATFDGLNKYGYPYDPSIASSVASTLPSGPSDTLTSMPIRLDSIPSEHIALTPPGPSNTDSVYLSFYYQGKGFWDKPEEGDELQLYFYSPTDTTWLEVWSHPGYQFDPDSSWHIVMVPITDSSYFHDGFQFRFCNLSGRSGDDDHWHIDEVYLNHGRTTKDTAFSDASFVYDLKSPLKNYTQMPYNQYLGASDMNKNIGNVCIRSNDTNVVNSSNYINISTYYFFYNGQGQLLDSVYNGSNPLEYYNKVGYCSSQPLVDPALSYAYPFPVTASDSFTVKFYVSSGDSIQENNNIYFNQKFDNYYAYDDGSAEASFGLSASNFKMAASFTLNVGDTLRAVDIFFDPVIDVNLLKIAPFNFVVWGDNPAAKGTPGKVIYSDTIIRVPFFPDSPHDTITNVVAHRENQFIRYQLEFPVLLPADSIFYIGTVQTYTTPLNVGFDMNTDFHRNMFYSVPNPPNADTWYVFPGDLDPDYRGALMIHPVFGDSVETASIKKYNGMSANMSVYPNPSADYVFVASAAHSITKIVITNLLGDVVLEQTDNSIQKINVASLQSGAYLIKAFTRDGLTDTKKLIISK
jgi:hypothetical protein